MKGAKKESLFSKFLRRPYQIEETDNANVLLRASGKYFNSSKTPIIVSYPEALFESCWKETPQKNSLDVRIGDLLSIDFLNTTLREYGFKRVEFVIEPGQYSIRGGIVDVFSFSNDLPYRVEFFDEEIESIRSFDINTQLSLEIFNHFCIIPNVQEQLLLESQESFLNYLPSKTIIWIKNIKLSKGKLDGFFEKAQYAFNDLKESPLKRLSPSKLFLNGTDFIKQIEDYPIIEFGNTFHYKANDSYEFRSTPQPSFNKQFNLLAADLQKTKTTIKTCSLCESPTS